MLVVARKRSFATACESMQGRTRRCGSSPGVRSRGDAGWLEKDSAEEASECFGVAVTQLVVGDG